jgi:hypothetical protein
LGAEVASSRVCSFTDPSACQSVFQTADVELFPTAKGSFHAEVAQIGINRLLIQRLRISLPEISTVALKRGRKSIGFLTEENSAPLRHCGFEVLPGDIVVNNRRSIGMLVPITSGGYASGLWSDGARLLSTRPTSGLVIVRQRFACLRQIISSPCLRVRVIVECDL